MGLGIGGNTGSVAEAQRGGPRWAEPPQAKQILTDFIIFKTVSCTYSVLFQKNFMR